MRRHARAAVLLLLASAGCHPPDIPPGGPPDAPGGPDTILGTERFAWDQVARDTLELESFRWAAYVDGVRSALADVACNSAFGADGYTCSAPLPPLSAGAHTLEVATFVIVDGATVESGRSAALQVTVAAARAPASPARAEPLPAAWAGTTVPASGATLRAALVASGLDDPTDLAFAPDGRIFVADARGIYTVAGARDPQPALVLDDLDAGASGLLGLAVDPAFDRNHFAYAVYTARSTSGGQAFMLARFREAGGTFAERVVLMDRIPARPERAAAALRVGGDGLLYVAFDDGGDARAAGDAASPNGKVLRVNPDGSTPRDQAAFSPTYAMPYRAPRAAVEDRETGVFWVADEGEDGTAHLRAVARRRDPGVRGETAADYVLPAGTRPSSLAVAGAALGPAFGRNLLLASAEGRHLLRLWIDPANPTRVIGSERLFQDRVGALRVVATAPDGTTYFATATALGRLDRVP